MNSKILAVIAVALCLLLGASIPLSVSANEGEYLIKSSDLLSISVWKEEGLQMDVVVRPDGRISFPLVGEVDARGKTVEQVRTTLVEKLDEFIPDPVVTVVLAQSIGNRVFVIGKVQNPGVFCPRAGYGRDAGAGARWWLSDVRRRQQNHDSAARRRLADGDSV